MNIFSWLFKNYNPTRDWPQTIAKMPQISLRPFSIGSLKIGSQLNDLRFLGQPSKFTEGKMVSQLDYHDFPLRIELENGMVTEIQIPIGYGTLNSALENMPVAELLFIGGSKWNQYTTRQETRQVLGTPHNTRESKESDEFEDSYVSDEYVMNLEFNQDKKLTYIEVFVND